MTYFLSTYFLLLLVFIGYSVAGIYHLKRFGYNGDLTKTAIVIYVGLSLLIIVVSIILIASRQWPSDFNFQDNYGL